MLVKVPYIDKNDNYFYDIVKNESKLDSFFCYAIKSDLVYVNKTDKFTIKMPKVIKKLCETIPDENFIILELIHDTIYVFVNNGEKNFEYYEYSSNEQPLIQLFISTLGDGDKYNIYYVENEELKKIIDSVVNIISEHVTINKDEDIINIEVNITKDDIADFFTKVSLEDKIKNYIKTYKNKLLKSINAKKEQSIKNKGLNKPEDKKRLMVLIGGGVAALLMVGYVYGLHNTIYDNYLKDYFEEPVVVEEVIDLKPKIDPKLITLTANYKTFKFVEKTLNEYDDLDLMEISNNKAIFIGNIEKINDMNNKIFIDNNKYIVNEDIKINDSLNLEEFKPNEEVDINKYVEFRSQNQIILRIEKNQLKNILQHLLFNDTSVYNINLYKINDIYQIVLYSNNVIQDLNGSVTYKQNKVQNLVKDNGTFKVN